MAEPDESLIARWRRLDVAVREVRTAVNDPHKTKVPDAVAVALDALYDLWERWRRTGGFSNSQADDLVRSDHDGETTAALVHARGAKTHSFVEFGSLTDTYSDTYFDHCGAWRWQAYSDPGTQFATRNGWYARHVSGCEVLPPLTAALRWFGSRPELQ